jgi:hypothetical protein
MTATPPNLLGFLTPSDTFGKYAQIRFAVMQALELMQTALPVEVKSCTNSGADSPVGFVSVLPLVNQFDAQGNQTQHGIINNIPYMRVQGGANAVIMDPEPGDIGICVFASRDISSVKANRAQSNPGSFRTYDFSDGMYLGGILNGAPSQFVQFSSAGIAITSPTAIVLNAPDIQLTAPTVEINATTSVTVTTPILTVNGAMNVTGDIMGESVNLKTHTHSGVTTGSGDTGPPV